MSYIHVKVVAGARAESLREEKPSYFRVAVKEKAKGNMANRRVIEILSEHFNTKNIRLINGHQSPSKLFSIEDI